MGIDKKTDNLVNQLNESCKKRNYSFLTLIVPEPQKKDGRTETGVNLSIGGNTDLISQAISAGTRFDGPVTSLFSSVLTETVMQDGIDAAIELVENFKQKLLEEKAQMLREESITTGPTIGEC